MSDSRYTEERHNYPDSMLLHFGRSPMGVKIQQSWVQIVSLFDLIERFNIHTFVELGMANGGMGSFLIHRASLSSGSFFYLGVEKDPSIIDKNLAFHAGHNSLIVYGDDLTNEVREYVKNTINSDRGPALIFCDGGSKVFEMVSYHSILRPGDVICCHDYMPGPEEAIGSVTDFDLIFLDRDPTFHEIPDYRIGYRLPAFVKVA